MPKPLIDRRTSPIGRRLGDAADVHISLVGRTDLSGEIYRQLRAAILERRLRADERLPPTRELARRLGVSRMTVSVAYDRLISEGLATARTGSGTFVARITRHRPRRRTDTAALQPGPSWQDIPLPSFLWTRAAFDFRPGIPDAERFPYRTWRRLMARQFPPPVADRGATEHPAGHVGLRAAIAHHVGLARGVAATANDIVVTNGTQQAIDLIGRVLLRPGDQVAVEDPGYGPPFRLLRAMGMRVRGVPVDTEGLVVDEIPPGTRLVYATPAHQFPLGMTMSPARRFELLEWAARHDAAVVEDDYDSEFRFGGRPIEPLQLLDDGGRVIYVGSFAKTTLPSLRLGFIVAPASLQAALHGAKYLTDWHSPVPIQGAMAEFVASGHFARHVRRMRLVYETRHRLISTLIRRDMADELALIPSAAGLHVTALAREASVERIGKVVSRAASLEVACQPLAQHAHDRAPAAGIVLGYGGIATDRIEEGLARLQRSFATA